MSAAPLIQAVTFDVGGTLLEPWPSVGHVYAEVASRHGWRDLLPESLNRQFAAAWRRMENFQHTRAEWEAIVDATFQGFTQPPPSQSFFPELYERFQQPDAWSLFEDVMPTLDRLLLSGVRLGIISNWDERLRPLLKALKLCGYFEAILISHEVGFAKPSRVIFEQAARTLGLPPAAILHVGDSAEMDARGGLGAGFQARLLDRQAAAPRSDRISSLLDLPNLVSLSETHIMH